ncbi:MAG: hypothetical protein ACP5JV_06795, partial [Thermus sp.]|uniref:hypothetical protein n=1 Tax=Thermus sp. TaxID=275 RepID=UPI003D0DCDA9
FLFPILGVREVPLRETGVEPSLEPLEPLFGESKEAFLKRAAAYYEEWQAFAAMYPHAIARPWPTRKRDLLFLAWHEVEGLSYRAIADRALERLEGGHPTAWFLEEGYGQGKGRFSEDTVAKAVQGARRRLAIT